MDNDQKTSDMDDTRKGEIALELLKHLARQKGVRIAPDMRREVGNYSRAIGIEFDEGIVFAEWFVRELVEDAFFEAREDHKEEVREQEHFVQTVKEMKVLAEEAQQIIRDAVKKPG